MIAELYDTYYDELKQYASARCINPDDAEDLLQETFLKAMTHIELLKILSHSQRRAWLYRVLKNIHIDLIRRRKFEIPTDDLIEMPVNADPSNVMDTERLLSKIPVRFRNVMEMKYILGMTSNEISRILSMEPSSVRFRIYTAQHRLRSKTASTAKKDVSTNKISNNQ
ncbi:RNA polymerase sigma factor [bacterium]|nr:RNA polymerase sigma factor [candidate division CSSED10-310 bacterium]